MSHDIAPIELCLESLDPAQDEQPYVRCVALVGSRPGLGLTSEGKIVWLQNERACLLIWVSADNRLIIQRRGDAARVCLSRSERFLDLPENKPVVALHEDIIQIDSRAFRLHVHGVARKVSPPLRLPLGRTQNWVAGALVAASVAACHTNPGGTMPGTGVPMGSVAPTTEVSDVSASAPRFAQPPPEAGMGGHTAELPQAEGTGGTQSSAATTQRRAAKPTPPIEIRNRPPDVSFDPRD